jgi:hypothetical protein
LSTVFFFFVLSKDQKNDLNGFSLFLFFFSRCLFLPPFFFFVGFYFNLIASPSSGARSLEWITSWPKLFSDADGNGFLRYCGTVPTGAKQFGWLRYYCAPEGSGFPPEA